MTNLVIFPPNLSHFLLEGKELPRKICVEPVNELNEACCIVL